MNPVFIQTFDKSGTLPARLLFSAAGATLHVRPLGALPGAPPSVQFESSSRAAVQFERCPARAVQFESCFPVRLYIYSPFLQRKYFSAESESP